MFCEVFCLKSAIIADEATDVGHKEQLVVCIRWVDANFDIHEDSIEFINVPQTDAQTLTTCIKDCLLRLCLPISQCRGQAYYGARNMSGYLNGVAAKIQNEVYTISTLCALFGPLYSFQ